MAKFHEDMYLWQTICIVAGEREDIYNALYGNMWTIQMIEEMM